MGVCATRKSDARITIILTHCKLTEVVRLAVVQVAIKLSPMRLFESRTQAEIRQLDVTLKHKHTGNKTQLSANQTPR